MKRIDMWITDKQDKNIKDYIKSNEGENKSKVIRDALDMFFEQSNNEGLLNTMKAFQPESLHNKLKDNYE